jgi:hypothetical protein
MVIPVKGQLSTHPSLLVLDKLDCHLQSANKLLKAKMMKGWQGVQQVFDNPT